MEPGVAVTRRSLRLMLRASSPVRRVSGPSLRLACSGAAREADPYDPAPPNARTAPVRCIHPVRGNAVGAVRLCERCADRRRHESARAGRHESRTDGDGGKATTTATRGRDADLQVRRRIRAATVSRDVGLQRLEEGQAWRSDAADVDACGIEVTLRRTRLSAFSARPLWGSTLNRASPGPLCPSVGIAACREVVKTLRRLQSGCAAALPNGTPGRSTVWHSAVDRTPSCNAGRAVLL